MIQETGQETTDTTDCTDKEIKHGDRLFGRDLVSAHPPGFFIARL